MKSDDPAGRGRARGLAAPPDHGDRLGAQLARHQYLLQEWPPLFSRGLAGVMAAALLAVALARGELALPPRDLPRMAVASFTNVFAWMGFTTIAMQWLTVGEGAMLVSHHADLGDFVRMAAARRATRPARDRRALPRLFRHSPAARRRRLPSRRDKLIGDRASPVRRDRLFALGTILNRAPVALSPIRIVVWQVGLGCAPMLILGARLRTRADRRAFRPLGRPLSSTWPSYR